MSVVQPSLRYIIITPARNEAANIERVIQSIRVGAKFGLPVMEYNFYAHRIVEGYYEEQGRGGAGLTAFDYDRVKDLPLVLELDLALCWRNIGVNPRWVDIEH